MRRRAGTLQQLRLSQGKGLRRGGGCRCNAAQSLHRGLCVKTLPNLVVSLQTGPPKPHDGRKRAAQSRFCCKRGVSTQSLASRVGEGDATTSRADSLRRVESIEKSAYRKKRGRDWQVWPGKREWLFPTVGLGVFVCSDENK